MRPERPARVLSLRTRPPIPPAATNPPPPRGGGKALGLHRYFGFGGAFPHQCSPSPPVSSAKGSARPQHYTSPSLEGEVGERSEPGGGGASPVPIAGRASPQGEFFGGPTHPHRPRYARPLPPLKRGKDISCGAKPFRRGILRGRWRRGAARSAVKKPFRQNILQNMGGAPSGSGKPTNSLFFRPNRRKQVMNIHAKISGKTSFHAGFCVTIGKALRTAAVPKSEAGQGVARSAAAPRPAVPAIFAKDGTVCPVQENGSSPCFFDPFSRI